jgi:hypothetical protein
MTLTKGVSNVPFITIPLPTAAAGFNIHSIFSHTITEEMAFIQYLKLTFAAALQGQEQLFILRNFDQP